MPLIFKIVQIAVNFHPRPFGDPPFSCVFFCFFFLFLFFLHSSPVMLANLSRNYHKLIYQFLFLYLSQSKIVTSNFFFLQETNSYVLRSFVQLDLGEAS